MNYEQIKNLAAENGVKVDDLIALSTSNDPYYTETEPHNGIII